MIQPAEPLSSSSFDATGAGGVVGVVAAGGGKGGGGVTAAPSRIVGAGSVDDGAPIQRTTSPLP
jgi:hypothetical protein